MNKGLLSRALLFQSKEHLRFPSYTHLLILLVLQANLILFAEARSVEIASKRYPLTCGDTTAFLPYESSHDLSVKNGKITRLIYSIHSASYCAKMYYDRATTMVDRVKNQKEKTLIIAPHFIPKGCLTDSNSQGILYWEISPFWGTSRAFFNEKRITISSYDITDIILKELVKGKNFPNLETIIILGHSGGGQMVNRYAASGLFESKTALRKGIEVRYIVMAPSSYVYFNNERIVNGSSNHFATPQNPPEKYNCWGYGLEALFNFHKRNNVTLAKIINDYPSKKILYLVGSKDTNSNDSSLDKSPKAMLQGKNRCERAKIYYHYLRHFFGDKIKGNQYFRVIENAGHSGAHLMSSKPALRFTFAPNKKIKQTKNCQDLLESNSTGDFCKKIKKAKGGIPKLRL